MSPTNPALDDEMVEDFENELMQREASFDDSPIRSSARSKVFDRIRANTIVEDNPRLKNSKKLQRIPTSKESDQDQDLMEYEPFTRQEAHRNLVQFSDSDDELQAVARRSSSSARKGRSSGRFLSARVSRAQRAERLNKLKSRVAPPYKESESDESDRGSISLDDFINDNSNDSDSGVYSRPKRHRPRNAIQRRRSLSSAASSKTADERYSSNSSAGSDFSDDNRLIAKKVSKRQASKRAMKSPSPFNTAPQSHHYELCAKCQQPASDLIRKKRGRPKKKGPASKYSVDAYYNVLDEVDNDYEESLGSLFPCAYCCQSFHKGCLPTFGDFFATSGNSVNILVCPACKDNTSSCLQCGEGKIAIAASATVSKQVDSDVTPVEGVQTLSNQKDVAFQSVSEPPRHVEDMIFRCSRCRLSWHYKHLPVHPLLDEHSQHAMDNSFSDNVRLYEQDWHCLYCWEWNLNVATIIAWREQPQNEYLVKFKSFSYRKAQWVPEKWIQSVAGIRYRNFVEQKPPPVNDEDRPFPASWREVDRVLAIEFDEGLTFDNESFDDWEEERLAVSRVSRGYFKWKEQGYEMSTWESPPGSESETYNSFREAYNHYIKGERIKMRKVSSKPRDPAMFQELEQQPSYVNGGSLYPYQLDGLNWLYYHWWTGRAGILADEMGLGKTIQVISFLAVLQSEHNAFPALIVVPNSTIANWMREIAKWAPELRAVQYNGEKDARKIIRDFELFRTRGRRNNELKAHIVVATYESVAIDVFVFKKVPYWEVLIIDEGQRVKSDTSQLFTKLHGFKTGVRFLLTGTPLQNNIRELFNLLNFLESGSWSDLEELERKYNVLTKELVEELHTRLKPYFLRRTKADVLKFLPGKTEIIVPLSMSSLQKEVYKSVLSKNAKLLLTITKRINNRTDADNDTKNDSSLHNILMQLRKTLQHPYLYAHDLEPQGLDEKDTLKTLTEASAKLKLLAIMLPKLKANGHRVLIFSQFTTMLDILEDFLAMMQIEYTRIDGSVAQEERQKRIDTFNDRDSDTFVFLLSTRAGGVGINLATADTVIIFDADFNPHQDIQAISRAHRIGQERKVLVFKLMIRASVEEKIVEAGRKKMVLDHLIIEKLGEETQSEDIEAILSYGARALFEENNDSALDIKYDSASVDKLLDRTQVSKGDSAGDPMTSENHATGSFSFARIWEQDKGAVNDSGVIGQDRSGDLDADFWSTILKRQEADERQGKLPSSSPHTERPTRFNRKRKLVNASWDDLDPAIFGEEDQTTGKALKRPRTFDEDLIHDEEFMLQEDVDSGTESEVAELEDYDVYENLPAPTSDKSKAILAQPRPRKTALTANAPATFTGTPGAPPTIKSMPTEVSRAVLTTFKGNLPAIQDPAIGTVDAQTDGGPLFKCSLCHTIHRRLECPVLYSQRWMTHYAQVFGQVSKQLANTDASMAWIHDGAEYARIHSQQLNEILSSGMPNIDIPQPVQQEGESSKGNAPTAAKATGPLRLQQVVTKGRGKATTTAKTQSSSLPPQSKAKEPSNSMLALAEQAHQAFLDDVETKLLKFNARVAACISAGEKPPVPLRVFIPHYNDQWGDQKSTAAQAYLYKYRPEAPVLKLLGHPASVSHSHDALQRFGPLNNPVSEPRGTMNENHNGDRLLRIPTAPTVPPPASQSVPAPATSPASAEKGHAAPSTSSLPQQVSADLRVTHGQLPAGEPAPREQRATASIQVTSTPPRMTPTKQPLVIIPKSQHGSGQKRISPPSVADNSVSGTGSQSKSSRHSASPSSRTSATPTRSIYAKRGSGKEAMAFQDGDDVTHSTYSKDRSTSAVATSSRNRQLAKRGRGRPQGRRDSAPRVRRTDRELARVGGDSSKSTASKRTKTPASNPVCVICQGPYHYAYQCPVVNNKTKLADYLGHIASNPTASSTIALNAIKRVAAEREDYCHKELQAATAATERLSSEQRSSRRSESPMQVIGSARAMAHDLNGDSN